MSRIPPLAATFGGWQPSLPRAPLRISEIEAALRRHKVEPERWPGIVETMQVAANDYLLMQHIEESGATKSEIVRHLKRVTKVEAELLDIFFSADGEGATARRVIRQRVALDGGPDGSQAYHLLSEYRKRTLALVRAMGAVKREAPNVAKHRRHIRLADALRKWFCEVGLPLQTTASSLMAQLLAIVLESVGEPHGKPQDLLYDATYPGWFREASPPRRAGRKPKATGEIHE